MIVVESEVVVHQDSCLANSRSFDHRFDSSSLEAVVAIVERDSTVFGRTGTDST
jgi:hypothetical protein